MREKIKNILGYVFEAAGYVFLAAVFAFMLGAYNPSQAVTGTWTQVNWVTGATGNTAIDPTNTVGWAQYSSQSNVDTTTGGQASLSAAVSTTKTSDADFTSGTHTGTAVNTGSGQVWLSSRTAVNIALSHSVSATSNKTTSCSGVDATPSMAEAVDGNTGTGWCATGYGSQALWVDLGSLQELSVTKMYWSNDDTAGVCVYWTTKYSSDGTNWTDAQAQQTITTPAYGNTIFTARSTFYGRYVKAGSIYIGTSCGANNKYPHLNELEVYGWVDGNYLSPAIDTGAASNFTTISYSVTIPLAVPYTDATIDVRGSSDGTNWSGWQTGIASGGSISALSGYRYIQYRANLSRRGSYTGSPSLNDITINYRNQSGNLISSIYNSNNSNGYPTNIAWSATTPAGTTVKFQVRTSADGVTWTGWQGPSGIGTYFTTSGAAMPAELMSGGNDQYMQYQAFLSADSSNNTPILTGVTLTYSLPDLSAPTPNPMTFATAPNNDSASQISMTATTGSDTSTPVSYYFTLNNTNCGTNAGAYGTASAWQTTTAYSDTGLEANKCYGYTVTARDSLSNTGTASSIYSAYTSANTPGTPTLSGATATTLNLTNAQNGNPSASPTTYFAAQVVTTTPTDSAWLNKWVNATGNPSATAVWLTDAQLDALVIGGLQNNTLYGVKVKARNQDNEETALSTEGQGTTSPPPDTTAPAATSNLSAFGPTQTTLDLTWTAPGDDGSTGTATTYDIRYSTATINEGNWASATQVTGEPAPQVAGAAESKTVTGLTANTLYYFAIKTSDEVPNTSAISNITSATTAAIPDVSAPTPDPMTFASIPANDSASQISMTATTASDTSSPVSYFFSLNNTNCGTNAGTYGNESTWQTTTAYSDTGLEANKCYGYTVTARDSLSNAGAASSIYSTYTSANTPGVPILTGITATTSNLTNAQNGNPASNPTTYFAAQVVTTTPTDAAWLNQWVNASGQPSATEVWLTDAQMDALTIQGLQYSTVYGVKVKARNQDNEETALSAEGQGTTSAAPEFDATFGSSGVSAAQISDSADANWGKVKIMYSVRDIDTTGGTVTPNYVTPSFEYNSGGGWVTITSGYLSANALNNKSVDASGYTIYTAYWDAKTQASGAYTASGQVRVTVTDNEGPSNITSVTVSSVVLDRLAPALTSATADSVADTVALNVSDNTNIQYRFSNNNDLSADGSNGTSGAWQTVGAASYNNSFAWTFIGAPSFETVYYEIRDLYNNVTTGSIIVPSKPSSLEIKDISNIAAATYKLFTNWAVYIPVPGTEFANYKIYRSTNGTSYSLLSTITDVSINYYLDTAVDSLTTYYYKLITTDLGGDVSNYSSVVSDLPNGQGGTDNTPPTISAVTVADTQAIWARITWTTDEVANSVVEYSTAAANNYALSQSSNSYLTSHDITLSGLTAGTAYVFRVKSTDAAGNLTTATNASYTFTTISGPSISAVAAQSVGENGATIVWNTSVNANSYVVYATSIATLSSGGSTVGSASLVGGSAPYAHSVALTGLTPNTTYYYYVKSTDASSNLVTNTNSGSYYNFLTAHDVAAPVISNIAVPVKTASALVVTWQTDELSDSQVVYGTASGSYPSATTLDSTPSINHVASLSGLTEATKYYFQVKSKDSWNNLATSAEQNDTTTSTTTVTVTNTVYTTITIGGGGGGSAMTDTTPPEIMDIKIEDIGPFEATVSFRTNEDTTGFALYGTTADLGKVAGDEKFRLDHKIRISGLKLGTDYYLRVAAADKGGNLRTSDEQKFTTQFAAESVEEIQKLENVEGFQEQLETLIESYLPSLAPPFISRVDVTDVTENSAKISFKTNTPAYGILQYALDRDYDEKKDNPYATALTQTEKKVREHAFELTGLSSGSEYHIQAQAYVLPGVIGKSKDTIFYTDSAKISPEIVRVGNTLVELSWRTEIPTSSFAEYRDVKTKAVGQVGNPTLVKAHNLLIGNLVPNNSYDIRVFGEDERGQRIDGTPIRVKTKQDTIPPEVSAISINNALLPGRADKLQTVIAWKTNEPANSLVYFDEGLGSDEPKNLAGQYNEYVAEHVVIVTAMKPATVYRIKIVSFDESGNKSESPVKTILTPRSAESVLDIIIRNFEESFGFLRGVQ